MFLLFYLFATDIKATEPQVIKFIWFAHENVFLFELEIIGNLFLRSPDSL